MANGPSAIIKHVYREHLARFGEPDQSYRFDSRHRAVEVIYLDVHDVFIWRANAECEMTTFSTIGMCERPMTGAQHRAELHFAYRGELSSKEESELARFLDIAVYPFANQCSLDWWHTIREAEIPLFSKCSAILFYPAFSADGWKSIQLGELKTKILNVVPITQHELEMKREGVDNLLQYFENNNIDFFSDR